MVTTDHINSIINPFDLKLSVIEDEASILKVKVNNLEVSVASKNYSLTGITYDGLIKEFAPKKNIILTNISKT